MPANSLQVDSVAGKRASTLAQETQHLKLAIGHERKSGFRNSQGKESFSSFLASKLTSLEQLAPLHHQRELSQIRRECQDYLAWNEKEREAQLNKLIRTISSLQWWDGQQSEAPSTANNLGAQKGYLRPPLAPPRKLETGMANNGHEQRGPEQESLENMKSTTIGQQRAAALLNHLRMASPSRAKPVAHPSPPPTQNGHFKQSVAASQAPIAPENRAEESAEQAPWDEIMTCQEPAYNGAQQELLSQHEDDAALRGDEEGSLIELDWSGGSQVHERGLNGAKPAGGADVGLSTDEEEIESQLAALSVVEGNSVSEVQLSSSLYPTETADLSDGPAQVNDGEGRDFLLGTELLQIDPICQSNRFKLIIFDTETTGEGQNRIVELGALAVGTRQKFCTLINPHPVVMSQSIMDIHHISNEDVRQPDVPAFREVGLAFMRFVESQLEGEPRAVPVLAAHNFCMFDYKRLQEDFKRAGLELPHDWHFLDTLVLSRRVALEGESNRLGDLAQRFGIEAVGAHRAMNDVLVTTQVLPHLLRRSPASDLDELLDMSNYRVGAGQKLPIFGIISDLQHTKSPKQISRERREKKAEANRAKLAARASRLSVTTDDPIQRIEKAKQQRQLSAGHSGLQQHAGEVVPNLSENWVEVMRQPILERAFLDLDVNSTKSPFTKTQRKKLSDIGLANVEDLLLHYPRDYQHCSYDMTDGEYATILGTVTKCDAWSFKGNATLKLRMRVDPDALKELDSDNEYTMSGLPTQVVTYVRRGFGQRYGFVGAAEKFPEGSMVVAQGRLFRGKNGDWELDSNAQPTPFLPESDPLPPQIIPVYAQRAPVSPKDFQNMVSRALTKGKEEFSAEQQLWEPLPGQVIEQQGLMSWFEAIQEIHSPSCFDVLEEARQRLAFEELLMLQLTLLLRRELCRAPRDAEDVQGAVVDNFSMLERGRAVLPYTLTKSQEKVLAEVLDDLQSPSPMMRLLQGDVGCGKTIVAFLALLAAAGSGFQGAMMAPTEVLAEQHFRGLTRLVERMPENFRPRIAIITGSSRSRERRDLRAALEDGTLQIVIGTHALISDDIKFARLGLAVVDEQHKFGVEQRAKLQGKASPLPHVLTMTATPIPRTLALVSRGDMAFCTINELPPGRRVVATDVVQDTPDEIDKMYEEVKKEIAAGGRAFIVYPLIEESATERFVDVKAAEEEYNKLQSSMKLGHDAACGLLHGRMSAEEKQAAVMRFCSGETPVLVSTSVVEVGMDVPEASVMIVNHAERFGLAQLHQLRGRVGRGSRPSRCFLVNAGESSARKRLRVLADEHSGLQIAEADMAHRGQGDVLGKQQSGKDILAYLRAAKLPEDRVLMEEARGIAAELIAKYGLQPADWPPELLTALARTSLPKLDYHHLPGGPSTLKEANLATAVM